MNRWSIYWQLFTDPASLRRSLTVGLVVGAILNSINQGARLIALDPDLPRLLLTFIVPFLVSSYAGISARLRYDPGLTTLFEVELRCATCEQTQQHLQVDDIIPQCGHCGKKTRWISISKLI